MTQENIKEIILSVFEDMGITIEMSKSDDFCSSLDDVNLFDYIKDSLMFISFILELEEKLGTDVPDDLLLMDYLMSLSGFSNLLCEKINEKEVKNNEKKETVKAET